MCNLTHENFSKGVCSFKDMYHYYYTYPELGIGKAASMRQPCNCIVACGETIRKLWVPGRATEDQPRFLNLEDCFWRNACGKHNDRYYVDISPVGKDNDLIAEDLDEAKHDILHHVIFALAKVLVEVGNIGAVATSKYREAPTGVPFVEQEDTSTWTKF